MNPEILNNYRNELREFRNLSSLVLLSPTMEARRQQLEELLLTSAGLTLEEVNVLRGSSVEPAPKVDLDKLLKKRHLNQDERRLLHSPASDWREGKKGEVCRNACSLDISDLLTA